MAVAIRLRSCDPRTELRGLATKSRTTECHRCSSKCMPCVFSPKQRPHLYTESNVKPPAKPPNRTHTVLPSSCGTTPRFVVCSSGPSRFALNPLTKLDLQNEIPAQRLGTKSRSLSVACFCAGTFFQRAFETGQGLDPAAKVELSAT